MATKIYESGWAQLIDGRDLYLTPLKIKYLREFMIQFEKMKTVQSDDESMEVILGCALIAMKQYLPEIKTVDDLEDSIDLKTMYKIINIGAGVKMGSEITEEDKDSHEPVAEGEKSSWDTFDLARLESEVFLLGIWRDYEELETSLSMPELTATLEAKREADYQEKKFLASIQGIDLEANSKKKENAWDRLKAKHFSGGATQDGNDVVSLQGYSAQKAGFGIGMGLDYERLD